MCPRPPCSLVPTCMSALSKWVLTASEPHIPKHAFLISRAVGSPGSEQRMPHVPLLKLTLHVQTRSSSFPEHTVSLLFLTGFPASLPCPLSTLRGHLAHHSLRKERLRAHCWDWIVNRWLAEWSGVQGACRVSGVPCSFPRGPGGPLSRVSVPLVFLPPGLSPWELPQPSSPAGHIQVAGQCVQCVSSLSRCIIAFSLPHALPWGVVLEDNFINPTGTMWACNFHFPTVSTTFAFNLA